MIVLCRDPCLSVLGAAAAVFLQDPKLGRHVLGKYIYAFVRELGFIIDQPLSIRATSMSPVGATIFAVAAVLEVWEWPLLSTVQEGVNRLGFYHSRRWRNTTAVRSKCNVFQLRSHRCFVKSANEESPKRLVFGPRMHRAAGKSSSRLQLIWHHQSKPNHVLNTYWSSVGELPRQWRRPPNLPIRLCS